MNDLNFNRLLTKYVIGLGVALALSLLAFFAVTDSWLASPDATMAVLLGLAVVQLVVQLVCFLHLDVKGRSAGRTWSLAFTLLMMLFIAIGSIWIMRNLDYRMSTSSEAMNEYMQQQNKKGF